MDNDIATQAAHERVRVARALPTLPLTNDAFLAGRLDFAAIVDTVAQVVDEHGLRERPTLVEVLESETWARARATELTGEACP